MMRNEVSVDGAKRGQNINWFPGHMAQTLKMIDKELKICDAIIYILDARCPLSCLNPKFDDFIGRKPVLFVLNKIDLAAEGVKERFVKGAEQFGGLCFRAVKKQSVAAELDDGTEPNVRTQSVAGGAEPDVVTGTKDRPVTETANEMRANVITRNSVRSGGRDAVAAALRKLLAERIAAKRSHGINKILRVAVIGVTNCGKSTFINNMNDKGKTKTGDSPGVTKTKQWVNVADGLWLLDTPGTLWPSFENRQIARNLAYVGSIRDDILDTEELAKGLLDDLEMLRPGCVQARFGAVTLDGIARKRGFIVRGGGLDSRRAAKAILTEFRAGKIGKFDLDALWKINTSIK
jgi:ribosome biogenesis GTPase A